MDSWFFGCSDEVESQIISSLLYYFRTGFNFFHGGGSYNKYNKYDQGSKSIVIVAKVAFKRRRAGGKEEPTTQDSYFINKIAEN